MRSNMRIVLLFGVLMFMTFFSALSSLDIGAGPSGFDRQISEDQGFVLTDQKEIPPTIKDIQITGSFNDYIFPNTPVIIKVLISGATPEKVVFFPDMDRGWINFTYVVSRNEFLSSTENHDLVIIALKSSGCYFNSSAKTWEVSYGLNYNWSFPGSKNIDVGAFTETAFGARDSLVETSFYTFEKDIVVSGEPKVSMTESSWLTAEGYAKGDEFLLLEGVSVHFEDCPAVSPDPSDITLGVEDSKDRVWEYKPTRRDQLTKVSFSFLLPKSDGIDNFTFRVFTSPSDARKEGNAQFQLTLDSTPPVLGDFRFINHGTQLSFTWEYREQGSGIRFSDLKYRITDREGVEIITWQAPSDLWSDETKLGFTSAPIGKDEFWITLDLNDRVGNSIPFEDSYMFSTINMHMHDLAIPEMSSYTPDIPIVDQFVHIEARIQNMGMSAETDVVVEIFENGAHHTYISIGELPAGGTREFFWSWKATDIPTEFTVVSDPFGKIDDEVPSNDRMTIKLVPEYLDIFPREDYMFISDMEADSIDLVEVTFIIRSIGSIESGPVKVLFIQDERFLGLYEIPSIPQDGSSIFKIQWKVDNQARNLTLIVDPYNENLESIENNNRVDFSNPFFGKASENEGNEGDGNEQDKNDDPYPLIDEGNGKDGKEGGTIWIGPEDGSNVEPPPSNSEEPLVVIPPDAPRPNILPIVAPAIVMISGLTIISAGILAVKIEPARYKLFLLLIPLYSKLRRDRVEEGTRFEILGYLKAKPGANYSELKSNLDLNDGTLVHHLRVLEREEKIYSKKMGKYKLFYVTSYQRQPSMIGYISPLHKRILEIISQNPGIVPKRLSFILDRSQTDVSYHLSELSRNGLLEKKKKGRNIHYYINTELMTQV